MKSICRIGGEVDCTLANGLKCENYSGPLTKTFPATDKCPEVKCIQGTLDQCKQDVTYDFKLTNRFNDQTVKFDLESPQIANSKVAWRIVEPNKSRFAPLSPKEGTRES